MGTFSIVHWIIVLAVVAAIVIPIARILRRAGLSPWWAVVSLIPIIGLLGLWTFAYAPWPKLGSNGSAKAPDV